MGFLVSCLHILLWLLCHLRLLLECLLCSHFLEGPPAAQAAFVCFAAIPRGAACCAAGLSVLAASQPFLARSRGRLLRRRPLSASQPLLIACS